MAVSWVQLALTKVAYKNQVFSLLTKHVDLSQIIWPHNQSVNCTAITVVILFWVFRAIGREGPLLTRAEKNSYKQTVNTHNAAFPQEIWMFWLKKIANHFSSIFNSGLNCYSEDEYCSYGVEAQETVNTIWLRILCRVFENIPYE